MRPRGLFQPLPLLPSPSCQKADDPSTHPPSLPPRRPSHLSLSLSLSGHIVTLQAGEERASGGRTGKLSWEGAGRARVSQERSLGKRVPPQQGLSGCSLEQPGAAEAILLTLAA